MNAKITASALKALHGKHQDILVSLMLRTNTPLTCEEMTLLKEWGGELLYDSGIVVMARLPAGRVNDISIWDCVIEVVHASAVADTQPAPTTSMAESSKPQSTLPDQRPDPLAKSIDISKCSFEEYKRLVDGVDEYYFGTGDLHDASPKKPENESQQREPFLNVDHGVDLEKVFDLVWRFEFTAPGFAIIDVGVVDSHTLRLQMVNLKRRFSETAVRRGLKPFVYRSLGRFDQQETTKLHLDGAPTESLLMLGYEPSTIHSRLFLADYTRAAFDLGVSIASFLQDFNPMFKKGEELLQRYVTELPQPTEGHSRILLINNSSLPFVESRTNSLGVMHQATIINPNDSQTRIINSTMLTTEGDEIEQSQVDEFVATEDISKKVY
jgi:hypothetical protein